MSDVKGSEKLLAGHAPAVMVGGMRVGGVASRPERTKSESKSSESSLSDEEKVNVSNDSSNTSPDKNNK